MGGWRFVRFVARRHLLARRRGTVINHVMRVAIVGISVASFALVVVLSAFNGVGRLVESLYSVLDTDLRIQRSDGRVFLADSVLAALRSSTPDTQYRVGGYLSTDALFGYREKRHVGRLVGIDGEGASLLGLEGMAIDGGGAQYLGSIPLALVGAGVAYYLRMRVDHLDPLEVYLPDRLARNWLRPEQAFREKRMQVGGVLSVHPDFDETSVVIPLKNARELLGYDSTEVEYLMVEMGEGTARVAEVWGEALGSGYEVLTRGEQNAALHRTVRSERFIVILILVLILVIASFNVVGSVSMLIIDKREEMRTLWLLGAPYGQLRRIFAFEGVTLSLVGAIFGSLLGVAVVLVQERWGLVTFPNSGSFVVDAYPVYLRWGDLPLVLLINLVIGLVASRIPLRVLGRGLVDR